MRQLSDSLSTAQKQASRVPYVKVEATNKIGGVVRLKWTRLYTGSEADYCHAVTMPGDGSLVRVRITPLADSRKLYRQRVTNPGSNSNFSQWTYTEQYNAVVVAGCSLGAEVSIFWIKSDRKIYQQKSTDYGAGWGSPELLDYTPSEAIYGIAAAYKPNGDIALFFADQTTLYVMKRINGTWQSRVAWDKSTGDLSGVATIYDGDWKLIVTGKDASGNFKAWSLLYGDGGEVSIGTWSALKTITSAPSDGDFEYSRPFMDKPDVCRLFFAENFSGVEDYHRPFWSYAIPGTSYLNSYWREPVPFDFSGEYGLALAHYGDYCWLSAPNGVWRAGLAETSLDLTKDVMSLRQEVTPDGGKLTVELRNDAGQYASPGQGTLSALDIGCQLNFSPGYVTAQGNEVSSGQSLILQAYEHTSSGGKASLFLYALDGWDSVGNWVARHQFRWNKDTDELSVKDMISLVLARAGLKLEVKSQSSVITGFYPDFTIHPGDRGKAIINKLLSFVPDVIFIEGDKAYLVNPLTTDSSVYSYGGAHRILEGRYKRGAWELNRVQVEGFDAQSGEPVIADSFVWSEIDELYDRLVQIEDRNIDTAGKARDRGEAYLRQAEMEAAGGMIRIPVNCGQQLYDVIDITDSRAGLSAEKWRVLGIGLVYEPQRGMYEQKLSLGTV